MTLWCQTVIIIFRNVLYIDIYFAKFEAAYFWGLMKDDELCDIFLGYFWKVSIFDAQFQENIL